MVEAESDRKEASPLVANMKFLEIREKKIRISDKTHDFWCEFCRKRENLQIFTIFFFFNLEFQAWYGGRQTCSIPSSYRLHGGGGSRLSIKIPKTKFSEFR